MNNEKYIVTIGRPSYQKNPFFLVDVIKGVHKKHSDIKFFLLGVGFYSPDLELMTQKIEENGLQDVIVLKEWLDHQETLDYVQKSILYLTVSRYEGLPLAVVEAMAMGKCVVASKVVGNVDCVRDRYNGRVLDLNVDEFVDAICELLENPVLLEEYGNNARKLYEEEFDIRKRIGLLEDVYRKVARKR